ncbi:MAG: non-homologous end-joining DNA ligase, partial [Gaiellales bacterium]
SWAVPKGMPLEPKQNRLAIRTEDHPLEYLDFEGEIPEGSYGAGTMRIWDRGTFELEELELSHEAGVTGKVHVRFDGERIHGRYMLVRTREQDGREQWLLRRLDPPEDPDAEPLPEHVKPMLAKLAPLPDDPERWAFEVKWDGIRAIVFAEGGRIRIETRTPRDVTAQYPDLAGLGRVLGARRAVIDGEIIAFDEHDKPSFQTLQQRLGLSSPATIKARAAKVPVRYLAFDLLHLDGSDLRQLPYLQRRALLRELLDDTPGWQVPAHHIGAGEQLLAAVVEQGLEGVVAKRLDSTYVENSRAGAWRKIKVQQRQEFVICGWSEGEGRRAGGIGALLLGYYDVRPADAKRAGTTQQLRFAGSVGTGFSDATLDELAEQLAPLETDTSPYDIGQPDPSKPSKYKAIRGSKAGQRLHFAEPKLVCEVEFTEFTRDGTLRHPSFKGLRDDKRAIDVIREGAE